MIHSDDELHVTQARIERFQRWLEDMRKTSSPEDYKAMSSSYRLEIERMQAEVLDYLLQPVVTVETSDLVRI